MQRNELARGSSGRHAGCTATQYPAPSTQHPAPSTQHLTHLFFRNTRHARCNDRTADSNTVFSRINSNNRVRFPMYCHTSDVTRARALALMAVARAAANARRVSVVPVVRMQSSARATPIHQDTERKERNKTKTNETNKRDRHRLEEVRRRRRVTNKGVHNNNKQIKGCGGHAVVRTIGRRIVCPALVSPGLFKLPPQRPQRRFEPAVSEVLGRVAKHLALHLLGTGGLRRGPLSGRRRRCRTLCVVLGRFEQGL